MTGELVADGHLGGYVAGGDPATFYPDLWRWLTEWAGVRSVLDVGCGDGIALRYFRELGCQVLGVDGIPQQDDLDIVCHDYTRGPLLTGREFDLCWSCEFVEHVEEQYIPSFLATFREARMLLMTHAAPGQAGYHHVNCRPAEYWIERVAEVGFLLDQTATDATRALAARNPSPWNHFVRSGLAFRQP